jgi:hypothetical protein
MTWRHAMRFAVLCAGLAGAGSPAAGQANEAPAAAGLDRVLAQEEAVVRTAGGRVFRGHLDGWRDGRLWIRHAASGGEVGHSFAPPDIVRLDMPGAGMEELAMELLDRGETGAALPLLGALARQRVRYLPVLRPDQRRAVFAFLEAGEAAGDPCEAIGMANQVSPYAAAGEEETVVAEAKLSAWTRLGLRDDARRQAREWCAAAGPAGSSALGWAVLARLAWEDGDAEGALWVALQPVAFSGHRPPRHLDACYAWAVCAAHRLGADATAARLAAEMRGRGLSWPREPEALVSMSALYGAGAQPSAEQTGPPDPFPPRRPERAGEKPPLTLDDARRLVRPSTP